MTTPDTIEAPESANLLDTALSQFDRAAERLALEPDLHNWLKRIKREFTTTFPVRMDDGTMKMFKGYRIQHNNILGSYFML